MLTANKRNYKEAFKKHYHAFINWQSTGSETSKVLILAYAVECGLKFMIMEEARIYNTKNADDSIKNILHSHDYSKLLKQVKWTQYSFIEFKTEHNDTVNTNNFHEFCRYCIRENGTKEYLKFSEALRKIATQLDEDVKR